MLLEFFYKRQRYSTTGLYLRKSKFTAIIADSFIKQLIGLMFRDSLPQKSCMLFKFPRRANYGIWMRNMRFPIDIIWADEGLRVVDIVRNAKPCSGSGGCRTYHPRSPAKYVLETNSGAIARTKIRVGELIKLE